MPYDPKQHKLFCAAAQENETGAKLRKKHGLSLDKAKKMCSEGVKESAK